jgi:cytochrome c-type biogenesis protein CcmH/NrfF
MLALFVGFLFVGLTDDRGGAETDSERAQNIAESLMCPTCRGQAVADSDAPAARAIREEIDRGVADGKSSEQIRAELAATYGDDIQLTPERSGVAGLVWALPVAVLVAALVGVGMAFRRWRDASPPTVSDADRELVEQAMTDG